MALDPAQFEFRGRETVRRLRASLVQQRLVERFVDSYVTANDRAGLKASALRYRELLTTLSREAWLALAAKIETLLPGKLSRRKKAVLRRSEAEAANAFRGAFLDELAKTLQWMPSDREEFDRDLALYAQIAARQPRAMRTRRTNATAEGAFVDRCALLLDPALLDRARAAASKFLLELESLAEETLKQVFGARSVKKAKKGKD